MADKQLEATAAASAFQKEWFAALRRRVLRDYNWEAIYQTGLLPLFRR